MNHWMKLPASLVRGFLLSAARAQTQTDLRDDGTRATSQAGVRELIVLFGTLSPEIADQLLQYLSPAEVAGMTPTIDDLRVQKKALALIARAMEYINREGPFIDFETPTEHPGGLTT